MTEPDRRAGRGSHVPGAEAGTEFVQFSPAAELAEVKSAMMKAMQPRAD